VDYQGIAKSKEWKLFEKLTAQLHYISFEGFDDLERKVFFINLYNTGVIHGYIKFGFPGNILTRLIFYSEVGYQLNKHFYSLNEIENGILRHNGLNAASGASPFDKSDPRCAYMVTLDPRIHFALVCGAKSCPPIRIFSVDNCDRALQLAARVFCQNNVQFQDEKTIVISPIFKWYAEDFGKEPSKVVEFIGQFVGDEEKVKIRNLPEKFALIYSEYNWNPNSNLY